MYDLSSIIEVHLEITSKCSVRCPQCPRNSDLGVTNPNLPEVELRLADVRHIFSEQFLSQLLQITICGNYGDPTAAQDTLAVVEYLRAGNKGVQLQVNSHGSTRSIDWWRDLGAVGVRCHFSIDGLKDTNHVYRRGTHWDAIIRNVRAFIEGGGTAVWEFLVFAHNEHQVQEARALSVSLGVKHFVVKKTVRFMREGRMIADMPMHSKSGTPLGVLSLPTSIQYQNAVLRRMSSEIIGRAEYETYIENTPIRCKAVQKRGIYISAEGLVFPCCYLGHFYPARPNAAASQMAEVVSKLPAGKSSLSALLQPLERIVNGPFFQSIVPDGWRRGPEARLRTCAQQCGAYDMLSVQCAQS